MGEHEENNPLSTHLRTQEPVDMPIERFLSSMQFDSKEKIEKFWKQWWAIAY
jgi:hypothetical protein